jgi:cbb3-type cytochrome oxidase subunit 3
MKHFIRALSLLFLTIVLVSMASWILLSSNTSSFEEAKSLYVSQYPEFFRSAIKATLLNIVLAALAGIGFFYTRNSSSKVEFKVSNVLAGVSFFLASWQLFSLL